MKRLAAICTILAACAGESSRDSSAEARAALASPDAAVRYEALIRLGTLQLSEDSKRSLVTALRDKDDGVRLLAAIAIVAQGASDSLPSAREGSRQPDTPNPPRVPDEEMDTVDRLVYVDPWVGGTFLRGLVAAARDEDERVRTLALRAIQNLGGPRNLRRAMATWPERTK